MDITEIRTRNLLHVLENVLKPRGIIKNKDAAQALGGLGSSYLSQLKGGKKIGDETARKIESALHWKHGTFDMPQWKAPVGVKDEGHASYASHQPQQQLSTREEALLANYRAATEATKSVVDAAAAAGAQLMHPQKKIIRSS